MKNLISTITPKCDEFLYLEPKAREEIKTFMPTRHELIQLVKYWQKERIRSGWDFFLSGCTGSIEASLYTFAEVRINHLREVIGGEDVDKAISEAYEEFSKSVN